MPDFATLTLSKGADRRLRTGHSWIYANEFGGKLAQYGLAAGALVGVRSFAGEDLGWASFNPNALIAARLFGLSTERAFDREFIVARLRQAQQLRVELGKAAFGRQVHSEGDGLPGVILDRYGPVMVGQLGTWFWELRRAELSAAVCEVFGVDTLVWKNDSSSRALEGLPSEVVCQTGVEPLHLTLAEGALELEAPLRNGQKTGWFYDQTDNRSRLAPRMRGKRVLDLYCYLGGWGLHAARVGALEVTCVDASEPALNQLRKNAESNALTQVRTERADVFDFLKKMHAQDQSFDFVVVDPPAFAKRKKDLEQGSLAYRRLFELALRVVAPGGFMVACSCSHHYDRAALNDGIARAAARLQVRVKVLAELSQGADHPVHPAMPETAYLKGVFVQVLYR